MTNNSIKAAILTVSDRSYKGLRDDQSGPALINYCKNKGWDIRFYEIVPDEIDMITVDLILTTGGTGLAIRDVTPEATEKILTKKAPGIADYIRMESMKITPHAMLSRGISGVRNRTLIINLPGSPKAAIEGVEFIDAALPHALDLIHEVTGTETDHSVNRND